MGFQTALLIDTHTHTCTYVLVLTVEKWKLVQEAILLQMIINHIFLGWDIYLNTNPSILGNTYIQIILQTIPRHDDYANMETMHVAQVVHCVRSCLSTASFSSSDEFQLKVVIGFHVSSWRIR